MFSWWCSFKLPLNGRIKKEKIFKNIFIQPARDAGISYGSCLFQRLKEKIKPKE